MKKAFDQTVRDLKRGVNKKVLKVPGIEQKVLDATSNEPWGPHGSHLADIAQATRNYHEYQMIMGVLWKRINDTGKNWRHVYKALTVLDYLVAHGSERVIDEIREHAYQISTLSDFQYIDSSGRDQGSNVRKKSQSLVVLVNDKERIQEVRQKAAANRDKFRNTSSTGGMYKPSGRGGYGDQYDDDRYEGRYGSRDDDRNGYGRDREGYREDDRYGRYGDSNSRDGDRYSRDSEERYGRDGYKDDDYRGRSRSVDYQNGSRSRSSDRERDRAYEDDGQYSSRGSGAKADDQSQDGSSVGRRLDRKFSEQNLGAPPSYEEAVGDAHDEKDGETSAASVPKESSPTVSTSPNQAITNPGISGAPAPVPVPASANKEVDGFDEFDPRGSFPGAPTTSNGTEMDLLGSLSESFSSNSLALVPISSGTTTSDADTSANFGSGPTFEATSSVTNQAFEDPFGDGPFRAVPSAESVQPQPHNFGVINQSSNQPQQVTQREDKVNNFDFGDTYVQVPSTVPQFSQESFSPQENTDVLADILPPSGPSPPSQPISQTGFPGQTIQTPSQTGFPGQTLQPGSQTGFPGQTVQPASQTGFLAQTGQPASQVGFPPHTGQPAFLGSFPPQMGQPTSLQGFPSQMGPTSQTGFPAPNGQPAPPNSNYYGLTAPNVSSFAAPVGSQAVQTTGPVSQQNSDFMGNMLPQPQYTTPITSQPALTSSTGQLAIVPQQGKDKFETKSAVWADTLSRGLVNLNISGPKTNPLADIGVDFEAINRREKRMEKPSQAPVTSTVTMGKAMGSGSGIGRAGATALRPSPNAMVGSGMSMGMGGRPVAGMGMGVYGGMNQPMGMGMGMGAGVGMGMNMPTNTGMGMNMGMGMGQGVQMPGPNGFPPASTMPGGYNPMMGGPGGYAPQQPYGGGYR